MNQQVAVFKVIKSVLLTLIIALLWIRFFCMLWDPFWGEVNLQDGLSIYQTGRNAFNLFYEISGFFMIPVYGLFDRILSFFPNLGNYTGFKTSQTFDVLTTVPLLKAQDIEALKNMPNFKRSMVGYVDLLVIVATFFYPLVFALGEKLVLFIKNLVLNLFIELSFTKRKESQYQNALNKRSGELLKLNVQYKNLSKEASVLAKSVVTDELTQVYNKRFFLEKVAFEFKNAKAQKKYLAIAMIDIDYFKKLNDTYGHMTGDKVLKAVAQVASASTPKDAFCCRFGGEEFTIIFPGYSLEKALAAISTIHFNIPYLSFAEDPQLKTSASFGVCAVNFRSPQAQELQSPDQLVKLADDELYKAKLNGRNRIETCHIAE
jgi:diguanylate cyclase (GGDEF)-like protein